MNPVTSQSTLNQLPWEAAAPAPFRHATGGGSVAQRDSLVAKPTFSWLVMLLGILTTVVMGCFWAVPSEYLWTAVLALSALIITGAICLRLLRVNPVTALVPCFFLLPTVAQTSLSTLYFCIVHPDIVADFHGKRWLLLKDNDFFQILAIVCVVSLALPWLLFQKPDRSGDRYLAFRRAAVNASLPTLIVFTACVLLLLFIRLASIDKGSFLGYLAYGLFRYTHALPLVLGVAWGDLSGRLRGAVLGLFALNILLNLATSTRYYAFAPVLFFAAGIMFLSSVTQRRKYLALAATMAVVAVSLVIGNAGRRLGAGVWKGGIEDLRRRYDILTQKSDQVLDVRWGDEIFGRMYFMGGNQITTLMPSTVSFKSFNLPIYVAEVASQGLLPRGLATKLVTPHYEEKSSLIAIGHRLTENHSVERSFIGAAWELGGFPPLILISMATGLLLLLITGVVEQLIFPWSPRMGVVCFSVLCDSSLQSIPEGLPSMAHECIYGVIVGMGVYAGVWFLGNTLARRSFLTLARLRTRLQPGRW
jgi:hypothetical protein